MPSVVFITMVATIATVATLANGVITANGTLISDTYFYGQSPPVYPSPKLDGTGSWADSYVKATTFVQNLTLQEKISLTAGASNITNGCSGIITAVPRLNFPGMCFSDASNGLRNTDFVSSWPSGIHVGASWNRELAAQRAYGIGAEFKKKGVNVLLGPVVSPAGRMVRSGRIWEGMSADPYLAGALVYETVTSSQKAGVITSTKHFIGNEQETHRIPTGGIASVSSNIDDRTMHELYLWPFQDAVHAGTGNIMCSYNRVNNSYACANSKILNGLLKTELGFQGFVVSDWLAQHAGTATVLSGLDMAMPNAGDFWGDRLVEAVQNGSVPEDRITDMATRIMASWYQMGQNVDFPTPGIGMPIDLTQPHLIVDGRNASDEATLRNGAIEAPKLLSVFGYSAKAPDTMNYSPGTLTAWTVGSESANYTDILDGFFYTQPQDATPIARYGTIFSGGGSGTNSQTLVSAPFDALQQQAWLDRTQLFWDFTSNNVSVHAASDACLVMINAWASESYDRSSLSDDYSDTLVTNVADQCSNTIVIVHNAGVRLVDAWIEHPNVTALIFAHLPGQYSGHALVDLLYGHVNPSGKLPYTVAKHQSDYGSLLAPTQPEGEYALFPQSNFNEGVLVDYRRFDALKITPRYEFGFGLSYTTFSYHNLHIQLAANITAGYPTGIVLQGGQADLWDNLVTVTANVTNTGRVSGAEVAQLYMSLPHIGSSACNSSVVPIPIRQLRGFDKQVIDVGTTAVVSFSLTRRDLSIWDATAQKWLLQRGTYTVSVGSSSRMLPLQGTFHVSDRE